MNSGTIDSRHHKSNLSFDTHILTPAANLAASAAAGSRQLRASASSPISNNISWKSRGSETPFRWNPSIGEKDLLGCLYV